MRGDLNLGMLIVPPSLNMATMAIYQEIIWLYYRLHNHQLYSLLVGYLLYVTLSQTEAEQN